MGEPVAVAPKAREILRTIFLRQHAQGVKFRPREKRLADILAMVRIDYPEATMDQLVSDELEYLKAERQEDECRFYREQNRCPWECGNLGRLWVVQMRETRSGPIYVVGFQTCGRYRAWQEKKRREQNPQQGTGEFVKAFSMVGGDRDE